jgi:hypothetical protein
MNNEISEREDWENDYDNSFLRRIRQRRRAEVAYVKSESMIRSEFEALAKKYGMKIESMTFSLI